MSQHLQKLSRFLLRACGAAAILSAVAASAAALPLAAAAPTPRPAGFDAISAETVNAEPAPDEIAADDGPAVLRAQILLDRANFSPGVLTGRGSDNMREAVFFFQQEHGLTATGDLDAQTFEALLKHGGRDDGVVRVTLSERDVRGPYRWVPLSVYNQADFGCLCYASALEMLDERYHTVTPVLSKLNPGVYFGSLTPGMQLWVPNVEPFNAASPRHASASRTITKIVIDKHNRYLHALAADGSIVYHFPTTIGSVADPSPTGTYSVSAVQWLPVFHYSPWLYSDVGGGPGTRLPPGPNSPVGVVWIATSHEHVGIHGTPWPHLIGLVSSHGCVRLTNWNAAQLASSIEPGTKIVFLAHGPGAP